MNRKGGPRRKSRQKMTKKPAERGRISIKEYFQTFKEGDMVQLVAEPSIHKGIFPLQYYGKKGIIKAKQGRSYYVTIKDIGKKKDIIVHPVHLKRC